jgi:hypothetical protein
MLLEGLQKKSSQQVITLKFAANVMFSNFNSWHGRLSERQLTDKSRK